MTSNDFSTARVVALIASIAIVIGAIGPWETTFLADIAGTKGDGRLTLILAILGGALVLIALSGSRWYILASVLGIVCAVVGIRDLIVVNNSTQTLFGHKVALIKPGWGLWLTVVASVVFAVSAWLVYSDVQDDPEPASAG